MRDKIKSESYYKNSIANLVEWIENKKKKTQELKIKLQEKLPLVNYFVIADGYYGYIYRSYSAGDDLFNLIGPCTQMLEYYIRSIDLNGDYSDGGSIIYNMTLDIFSMATLLQTKSELLDLANTFKTIGYHDYLIDFLLKTVAPDIIPANDLLFPNHKGYAKLKTITKCDKYHAEKGIKEYLEHFYYTKENLEHTYNSHKKNDDSYDGYWCWEAGAIVKIMGLDDSSFKDNIYYPYDMVHFDSSKPPQKIPPPPPRPISPNNIIVSKEESKQPKKKWWQF